MLARVHSAAVHGIDGYPIAVEVDLRPGFPTFSIVGLPDTGVRESRERVITAIKNSQFVFPPHKITVNLAPGHIKKAGPSFDFPIAIGVLAASELINPESLEKTAFLGELGLNGELRPVHGVLPSTLGLRKKGVERLLVPKINAREAALVDGIKVFPVEYLAQAVRFLSEDEILHPTQVNRGEIFHRSLAYDVDFSDVKGQVFPKRALEIAAAGGHNLLLLWTQIDKKRKRDRGHQRVERP